jgi:hypothetical protein
MEIFKEIYGLDKTIYQNSEDLELFRHYRFCRRIGESKFKGFMTIDHFSPDFDTKTQEILRHTEQMPVHLPQNRLVEILYEQYSKIPEKTGQLLFDTEVSGLDQDQSGVT